MSSYILHYEMWSMMRVEHTHMLITLCTYVCVCVHVCVAVCVSNYKRLHVLVHVCICTIYRFHHIITAHHKTLL